MPTNSSTFRPKVRNVIVATDFSSYSEMAILYATAIARRQGSKLFLTHVVTSSSEKDLMDGWRAGQTEITKQLIANRLDGIEHELVVKPGDIWPVLSQLIAELRIDLVVVGTRGRTGVRKYILGSVAQNIFHQALCPVLTIGPSIAGQDPEIGPECILTTTGFAPHSLAGCGKTTALREEFWLHLLRPGDPLPARPTQFGVGSARQHRQIPQAD